MELSRWTPVHITEWRFRRLLKASYWSIQTIVIWFSREIVSKLPQPSDRTIYVVGDGSHKEKRGQKNPAVQKGRTSKSKPFYFGIRFCILSLSWHNYRIPCNFRIILPKSNKAYKNENTLFREMLKEFIPPSWAQKVIVIGDSAYCSAENMQEIIARNKKDKQQNWFFVFAIARSWKTKDGKAIKNLAKYLPKTYFRRTWIPSIVKNGKRKTFWVYGKTICLRHIGDVTIVLSRKRRNEGPKKIKLIVTNLPDATPRQILSIYNRRWIVEIIFKELKTGLGLGQHQVTKDIKRVRNSIGVPIVAYLLLVSVRKNDITPDKPWSIFQLQNNFRIKVIENQMEHQYNLKIKKLQKAA